MMWIAHQEKLVLLSMFNIMKDEKNDSQNKDEHNS
jgi:hypothetical protein